MSLFSYCTHCPQRFIIFLLILAFKGNFFLHNCSHNFNMSVVKTKVSLRMRLLRLNSWLRIQTVIFNHAKRQLYIQLYVHKNWSVVTLLLINFVLFSNKRRIVKSEQNKLHYFTLIALYFFQMQGFEFQGQHSHSWTNVTTQCGQGFSENRTSKPPASSWNGETRAPFRRRQGGQEDSGPEPAANSTIPATEPAPLATAAPAR